MAASVGAAGVKSDSFVRTAIDGTVGGAVSVARGWKFVVGFASAGVASFAGRFATDGEKTDYRPDLSAPGSALVAGIMTGWDPKAMQLQADIGSASAFGHIAIAEAKRVELEAHLKQSELGLGVAAGSASEDAEEAQRSQSSKARKEDSSVFDPHGRTTIDAKVDNSADPLTGNRSLGRSHNDPISNVISNPILKDLSAVREFFDVVTNAWNESWQDTHDRQYRGILVSTAPYDRELSTNIDRIYNGQGNILYKWGADFNERLGAVGRYSADQGQQIFAHVDSATKAYTNTFFAGVGHIMRSSVPKPLLESVGDAHRLYLGMYPTQNQRWAADLALGAFAGEVGGVVFNAGTKWISRSNAAAEPVSVKLWDVKGSSFGVSDAASSGYSLSKSKVFEQGINLRTAADSINLALPKTTKSVINTGEIAGKKVVQNERKGTITTGASNKGVYNSHDVRAHLACKYSGQVSSSTVPMPGQKNVKLAGKAHPETGVVFDVRGFPIFDKYVKYDTRVPRDVAVIKNEREHMRAATRDLRDAIGSGKIDRSKFSDAQLQQIMSGKAEIDGLSWHHHQDVGRMQLIPRKIHNKTGHIGGMKLWFQ